MKKLNKGLSTTSRRRTKKAKGMEDGGVVAAPAPVISEMITFCFTVYAYHEVFFLNIMNVCK